MKTLIALVRHGVTDWNYAGRGQGHGDIDLNAEGRRQAEAVAEKLASEPWTAIYSSPLSRARNTAEAIRRRVGLPVAIEPRLIERCLGEWEGMTLWERSARFGPDWRVIPGVELDEALAERAREALTEVAQANPGGRIICVSHGGLIGAFLGIVTGGRRVHTRNTSVSRVWFDGDTFTAEDPTDFTHLLLDELEYSGEKGRMRPKAVAELVGGGADPHEIDRLLMQATALEATWSGDDLVGVLLAFVEPDGRTGSIQTLAVAPGFDRAAPIMRSRLADRFPDVAFA